MNAGIISIVPSVRFRFRTLWRRLTSRARIMADWKPTYVTLWCTAPGCQSGYYSKGEVPSVCPRCERPAHWTTTPPFKLTMDDKVFLKVNRIDPEC